VKNVRLRVRKRPEATEFTYCTEKSTSKEELLEGLLRFFLLVSGKEMIAISTVVLARG
jgi:hypothetical protein